MQLTEPPLFSADAIAARVTELGAQLSRDYADKELLLLTVLKGSVIFAVDLMRAIDADIQLDFVRAKSYFGTESTGEVRFTHLPEEPLAGRHVLIVEDILDTGRTASAIVQRLLAECPASLALCALLDKPSRRVVDIRADYVGFTIEDHFVVGYGLDHDERYRTLPAVHVLEP